MAKDGERLAELLGTQQSLTEWLEDIGHSRAAELRVEDNDKRERLKKINRITGMPFDEPTQFDATDLAKNTDTHKTYQHKHGDELCALRIIPTEDGLPKLRMRGLSVAKAYEWFKEQDIDPAKYRADYIPHSDTSNWATIFVVNEHGFFGEIIEGGHQQLTQGFHDGTSPIVFQFDFKGWTLSRDDPGARKQLLQIASHLHIKDAADRSKLSEAVGAEFENEYIKGYFETTDCLGFGLWFIDYNKTLGDMYSDIQMVKPQVGGLVFGQAGSPGVASGKVQIVHPDEIDESTFEEGSVLVCEVTTPSYVPVMRKAAAIVTNQGGILSHAAIVARELGVPCIVGTGSATKKLSNGQKVVVDADAGQVKAL